MDIQRDEIRAALDAVDAGYSRLRSACSDSVGNAFRVEVAERLERQHRVNRGLMYRFFGELIEPPDGPDDPRPSAGGAGSPRAARCAPERRCPGARGGEPQVVDVGSR